MKERRHSPTLPGIPEIIDQDIHMIMINVGIQEIDDVFLDGGFGVNIISIETCQRFGITEWKPTPFWVWMAN